MSLGIHRDRAGTPCGGTFYPYTASRLAREFNRIVVVPQPEELARCDRCQLTGILLEKVTRYEEVVS